jgi:DNA-binding NarL/FixJ family response regulator
MAARGPWSILIVDDEPMIASALADLVAAEPSFTTRIVEDVETAIAIGCESRPDAVLLDVRMPDGGGVRVARALRDCAPDVKVVALSAETGAAIRREMIDAGALIFLDKSSDMPDLMVVLRRILEDES